MNPITALIRRFLGHTQYHRQANEVQVRATRAELMKRYWSEVKTADAHFDRRRRNTGHRPERRGQHG